MKKLLLLILLAWCINGSGQKTELDQVYTILRDTIEQYTGESSQHRDSINPQKTYLLVEAMERKAELRTWPMLTQTFVCLLLTESDMVMTHQHRFFYTYKNGVLKKANIFPEPRISQFFNPAYLQKNNVSPNEFAPHPVLYFLPGDDEIHLHLQAESFDSTYMGQDIFTFLDFSKITSNTLSFSPDEGGFNLAGKNYVVDESMHVNITGGWERGCDEQGYFTSTGNENFIFSNAYNRRGNQWIQVDPNTKSDSVKVRQRLVYVYGKRVSETEGVIFYDTTNRAKPGTWIGHSVWENTTMDKTGKFALRENELRLAKKPIISIEQANTDLTMKYPEIFDPKKAGLSPEMIKATGTQLYAYMMELEISVFKDGKVTKKHLLFRIRHGEC